MAVGRGLLIGADYVSVRMTLARIANEQRGGGELRPDSYRDLFEYQRCEPSLLGDTLI